MKENNTSNVPTSNVPSVPSVPSVPVAGKNQVLIPDSNGDLFPVWYKPGCRLGDFMVKNQYSVEQTANAKEALRVASKVAGQTAFRGIKETDIVSVKYTAVIKNGVPIVKASLNAELKASKEFANLFAEKANKVLESAGKNSAKYSFVAASLRKDSNAFQNHIVTNTSKAKAFVERPLQLVNGTDETVPTTESK